MNAAFWNTQSRHFPATPLKSGAIINSYEPQPATTGKGLEFVDNRKAPDLQGLKWWSRSDLNARPSDS